MSSWGIVVQTGSWIRAGKHDRPTRLLLDDKRLALLQALALVSVLGVLWSSWGILIVVQTGAGFELENMILGCCFRPVARSGNGGGVRKTNVDLTSGRWPRWVARYEKGGWAVHFRSDIRKGGGGGGCNSLQVYYEKWGGGGGGAIRFRSITKRGGGGGGGQFASGPLRKVGGERCKPQKLRKPGPAPLKRTLTLLGGGGSFEPPEPPLATGLCLMVND